MSDAKSALLDVLRWPASAGNRVRPSVMWAGIQDWARMPLGADGDQLVFEGYVAGGRTGSASAIEVPLRDSAEFVACVEIFRAINDGANVGVGLYYPSDPDWRQLASTAGWNPDQPFLAEHWTPDAGSPDDWIASVEGDAFFQLALRKRIAAAVVFDTSSDDVHLYGPTATEGRD